MTDIVNESIPAGLSHESKAVGATEVQLTVLMTTPLKKGIQIKADAANTGVVYIGLTGVTANTTAATDGFPLAAGEGLYLPVDDPRLLYGIGSAAGQKVFLIAV